MWRWNAAVDVIITTVITGDGAAKLSVVVTGCVPMTVDGVVGIHARAEGLKL